MEQENNNTFSPQPQNQEPEQQTVQQPEPQLQPPEPVQTIQPVSSSVQPMAQTFEQNVAVTPSSVAADTKNTKVLVFGIISMVLGIISYVLPYTTLLFTSSSYGGTSDSIKLYFVASLVISAIGLTLGAIALKKSTRISLTGLSGFTLNLLSIVTGASQLLIVLSFVR